MASNRGFTSSIAFALMACTHGAQPAAPVSPAKKIKLAVLPAESDAFPKIAQATTESLGQAHVQGVDETEISKVSLEVVQLSIECVQTTPQCYEAVGKSLAADRLLFAQIAAVSKRQLEVTVTLFDVDGGAAIATAQKLFASENEATIGIAALVGEATSGAKPATGGQEAAR